MMPLRCNISQRRDAPIQEAHMSDPTQNSVSFPIHNPSDKRPLPEIIAEHYDFPLAYLDHNDGKRYYAVQDWIAGIAQAPNPRIFWSKLKNRLIKAGYVLYPPWVQLPYRAANGRRYQMEYAQAETLYQITQRMDANTGLRNAVLKFLASAGVELDEQRIDPERAIDAAIAAYKRQGYSEKWIQTRILSKLARLYFTAAFTKSLKGKPQQWQYAVITDEVYLGLWKRSTAKIKAQLGLKKNDNLRDNQSALALSYQMVAENLSGLKLDEKQDLIFDQAKNIVRSMSEFVGKQADEASQMLGLDIATDLPLLPDKSQND
jgi:hypothetical protein